MLCWAVLVRVRLRNLLELLQWRLQDMVEAERAAKSGKKGKAKKAKKGKKGKKGKEGKGKGKKKKDPTVCLQPRGICSCICRCMHLRLLLECN